MEMQLRIAPGNLCKLMQMKVGFGEVNGNDQEIRRVVRELKEYADAERR